MDGTPVADLPRFFRLRQRFPRPVVDDIRGAVFGELQRTCGHLELTGKRIALTAGSRGIANVATILRACVDWLKGQQAIPFVVPAMGSHGGATAEGQVRVLAALGIDESSLDCPLLASMDVVKIGDAAEGFPIYMDAHAAQADGVLVVNRIKPHTRFAGDIESGLMKMMLIGLGKQRGAEVYHRAIVNYSFDRIVRSVSQAVMAHCHVIGGLAILENAYEETAALRGVKPAEIETVEPELLRQVKQWMPSIPFDHLDLLIVDSIGKNISGTGMDTNVIGRKRNDHAAIGGDRPDIHHIYVRSLTPQTHGNASGIGLAEMCHRRVLEQMDVAATRMNCITANHITGAMLPVDFPNDRTAVHTACQMAGYLPPSQVSIAWIQDTLHLDEIECSEVLLPAAQALSHVEIVTAPRELAFDEEGDLIPSFAAVS
ncbi:MAG: hypothetical protein KatS3mg111_1038 [Pirellulaceae bacterium]|nr:MAG: hypothetical protein KatS3mg111_1038 [Pirellulaceae bacterium]